MKVINLKNLEDFEEKLHTLRSSTARPGDLLFRGQADAAWSLRTTLERRENFNPGASKYYQRVSVIKPQVEAFTQTLPSFPDYDALIKFWQSSNSMRKLSFWETFRDTST